MEAKLKHLEMIQGVINRMASNSFVFKGWSITIIAGLSAFGAKDANNRLLLLSVVAAFLFWMVDAYYLTLERAYRDLYDKVAKADHKKVDFRMNIAGVGFKSWFKTIWRPILCLFYGTVLTLLLVATLILWR